MKPQPPAIDAETAASLLSDGRIAPGTHVRGEWTIGPDRLRRHRLPDGLTVDVLRIEDMTGVDDLLPANLTAYELSLVGTDVTRLPPGLTVRNKLDLSNCSFLEELPDGFRTGSLGLRGCTALKELRPNLDVWFLDLSGCWALERWPDSARVRGGHLALPGCVALQSLPESLGRLAGLDVRECPQLSALPTGLEVTGWIDLAHCGLLENGSLPASIGTPEIRWGRVPIDDRIAFRPESITTEEVLAEKNAERRRVLIDRYGYGRLMSDLNATVLDADTDPGGERQLLQVVFEDDEDLVAMSCHCPSTGRQYVIRVPPATKTCHQAAAWIAGFDDPSDYRPLSET